MDLDKKVIRLVAEEFDLDYEDMTPDNFLADHLGLDPYDLEEIARVLRQEFETEIDEEEVENWCTIADIVQTILDKIEE